MAERPAPHLHQVVGKHHRRLHALARALHRKRPPRERGARQLEVLRAREGRCIGDEEAGGLAGEHHAKAVAGGDRNAGRGAAAVQPERKRLRQAAGVVYQQRRRGRLAEWHASEVERARREGQVAGGELRAQRHADGQRLAGDGDGDGDAQHGLQRRLRIGRPQVFRAATWGRLMAS
jgi:hypothetical protein